MPPLQPFFCLFYGRVRPTPIIFSGYRGEILCILLPPAGRRQHRRASSLAAAAPSGTTFFFEFARNTHGFSCLHPPFHSSITPFAAAFCCVFPSSLFTASNLTILLLKKCASVLTPPWVSHQLALCAVVVSNNRLNSQSKEHGRLSPNEKDKKN